MTAMIEVKGLSCSYGETRILEDISFSARRGAVTAVVGSNGTGKSTMLKHICGILSGTGSIRLDGEDIGRYSRKERAQRISYLAQSHAVDADINVFETVLLGRMDHLGMHVPAAEIARVWDILRLLEIDGLARRNIARLSGGQRQLVFIGQALVRDPEVLLLDEPTNNLDLQYTFKILAVIRRFTQERNFAAIVVLHDLNLLASAADHVVVLHEKKLYAEGTVEDILTERMLRDVYKMNVEFCRTAAGRTVLIPLSPCE